MDSFKSDAVVIGTPIEKIYATLSNPAALKNLEKLGTMPDDVKAKIQDVSFTEDGISFKVDPVGSVTLQVVERNEPTLIVYSATSFPIPFKAVINLEKVNESSASAVAELQMELNMFIRPMVEKPLTEGVKRFGDLLKILPYNML